MISFSSPFSGGGRGKKALKLRLKSLSKYRSKNNPENTDAVQPNPEEAMQVTANPQDMQNVEQSTNMAPPGGQPQMQEGMPPGQQGAPPAGPGEAPMDPAQNQQPQQQPKPKKEPQYTPMEVNREEVSGAQSGWTMLHDIKDVFDNDMNLAVATYALDQFEQDPKEAGKHIGIMLALSPYWGKKYSGEGVDQVRVLDLIRKQGGDKAKKFIDEIRKAYVAYEPSKFTLATIKD
ncbi:hypothetical protein C4577_03705 [Candidatus Parcubacteria bacterium]|nr:MAG: hypothetical protein C4577_03705 [Candidatus Parcubacteria bacterium]